jgi:formyltetrahydrofolate synthetase
MVFVLEVLSKTQWLDVLDSISDKIDDIMVHLKVKEVTIKKKKSKEQMKQFKRRRFDNVKMVREQAKKMY